MTDPVSKGADPSADKELRTIVAEEEKLLKRCVENLAAVPVTYTTNYDREMVELRDLIGDARNEDLPALMAEMERLRGVSTRRAEIPVGKVDESNPYFTFDASKCIACSRCVRACGEVQGTFALTISGRGFGSKVTSGAGESFLESECVSCGACVQACPTATLQEKSVIELGMPTRTVKTTSAYSGVGCSFKA